MILLPLGFVMNCSNWHREGRFAGHLGHSNNVQIHERKVKVVIHATGRAWSAFNAILIQSKVAKRETLLVLVVDTSCFLIDR